MAVARVVEAAKVAEAAKEEEAEKDPAAKAALENEVQVEKKESATKLKGTVAEQAEKVVVEPAVEICCMRHLRLILLITLQYVVSEVRTPFLASHLLSTVGARQ